MARQVLERLSTCLDLCAASESNLYGAAFQRQGNQVGSRIWEEMVCGTRTTGKPCMCSIMLGIALGERIEDWLKCGVNNLEALEDAVAYDTGNEWTLR